MVVEIIPHSHKPQGGSRAVGERVKKGRRFWKERKEEGGYGV